MQSMHVMRNRNGERLVANVVPEQISKIGTRFMICFHVRTLIQYNQGAEFFYSSLNEFDSSILRLLRHTSWIYYHLSSFKMMFRELARNYEFHRFLEHRTNISKFLNKMARYEIAGKFGDAKQGVIITFYVGKTWAGKKMIKYSNDSRRIINRLQSVRVSNDKSKTQCRCAVCLEEFIDTDGNLKMLCCSHVFHARCLGPWLDHKRVCPICNLRIYCY